MQWERLTLIVELSLPPSVNNSYVNSKKGRSSSKELRAFKRDAAKALLIALWPQRYALPHWQQTPRISYCSKIFVPTILSDLSNRLKAFEDALAEALGINDRAIYGLEARKFIDKKNPRIEAFIAGGAFITSEEREAFYAAS